MAECQLTWSVLNSVCSLSLPENTLLDLSILLLCLGFCAYFCTDLVLYINFFFSFFLNHQAVWCYLFMETLAMFLLSYKQVVEFKKAGTATLFAACSFYFYSAWMYVIRYALLRVFFCDSLTYYCDWLDINAASLLLSGIFLTFF